MYGSSPPASRCRSSRAPARAAPAHYFEVQIDTKKNEPRIFENKKIDWEHHARHPGHARDRGPLPEGPRLGRRVSGADGHRQSAREARLPRRRRARRENIRGRSTSCRPQPREIKPHPYGIEFGMLLQDAPRHQEPLARGISVERLQPGVASVAAGDLQDGQALARTRSRETSTATAAEALYKAIQSTKIMAPPTNCISPIGEKAILHGLYKQIKGEFYTAVTRPPAVYRGNPFVIEAGLAFGKGPEQAAAQARGSRRRRSPRARSRRGRRRAGPRHPLRQPRAAALPAVRLRDVQGRARDRLAELRRRPVPRRAARRARW